MATVNVKFYDFEKKENSTKQPTDATANYYITFSCLLKDACSFINPVLQLQTGFNPIKKETGGYRLNYAYISDFGDRYYFVDNWTFANGLWVASLRLDVLASWKNEIGGTTSYVLRSASDSNGNIVDTVYPTKGGYATTITNIGSIFAPSNGVYVLGIIGPAQSNYSTGAVQYYTFTSAQLKKFYDRLLSDTSYLGNIGTLTDDAKKYYLNPFQYITSAMFFPFAITSNPTLEIKYGWWTLRSTDDNYIAGYIPSFFATQSLGTEIITIPKHPQAATRGHYTNLDPYTRYSLMYQPFGEIALDSTKLYNAARLSMTFYVDIATGEAKMLVRGIAADDNTVKADFGYFTGQLGVPIVIAQMASNKLGAIGGVVSSIGSAFMNNPTGILSGIESAVNSALPQLQKSGSNGCLLDSKYPQCQLLTETMTIVDGNNDHKGSPLCAERQLNTLSGYIQCMDGEIEASATAQELEAIKSYLENGFFYE